MGGITVALCLVATACSADTLPGSGARPTSPEAVSDGTVSSATSDLPSRTDARTAATTTSTESPTTTDPPLPQLAPLSAPAYAPTTRTDELGLQLARTPGITTVQQAVDMFSLTFGGMPGATTSGLPAGDGFGTSTAMATILAHRTQLNAAQERIVKQYLDTPYVELDRTGTEVQPTPPTTTATTTGSTSTSSAPTASSAQGFAPSDITPPATTPPATPSPPTPPTTSPPLGDAKAVAIYDRYLPIFHQVIEDYRTKLPTLLARFTGFRLTILSATPEDQPTSLMFAGLDDTPDKCWVRVLPRFINDGYTDEDAKFAFAHELFHCAERVMNPDSFSGAPWLIEGSATFAAEYLYHDTYHVNDHILPTNWFTNTSEPLNVASYHAWALFETYHQAYPTADVFGTITNMVAMPPTTSTADLVGQGGMGASAFPNLWTSASYRASSFDDKPWEFAWPGTDPAHGKTDNVVDLPDGHGIGDYVVDGQPNFVHQNLLLPIAAEVGLIGVIAHEGPMMTRSGDTTLTIPEGRLTWFCTQQDMCPCPPDSAPVADLLPMSSPMPISMATVLSMPYVEVRARKWEPDKDCGPSPPPSPSSPSSSPASSPSSSPASGGSAIISGSANGDPHMTTLNGLHYEFMSLGEFVTTKDPSGNMVVQERNQSTGYGATIGAVAIGSGQRRATFTAGEMSPDGKVTVRLDGKPTTAKTFSIGDVEVTPNGSTRSWVATWPDGSTIAISWNFGFFVKASLTRDRAKKVSGVLGTYADNFLGDLALPDGTQAPPDDNYKQFADAWLVTDHTTLFDYEAGQTTATFRSAHPLTIVSRPSNSTILLCTTTLGKQATSDEVDSCEFDVTATGSKTFADTYKRITEDRVAAIPTGRALSVPTTSATGSTPTRPTPIVVGTGPTVSGAPGNQPVSNGTSSSGSTLQLQGKIGSDSSQPTDGKLAGSMTLKKGTVLLVRAQCPSDASYNIDVTATLRSGDGRGSVGVCGQDWKGETYNANSNAEIHPGEGYMLIRADGEYDIAVSSVSEGSVSVSVGLWADPSPTILESTDLPASGYTATLAGIGDTIVFDAAPGNGATWSIINGKQTCAQVFYIAPETDPLKGADDIGGVCWHHDSIAIGSYSASLPIVIFDRENTPVTITIALKP